MIRIATWNVNSIKARIGPVTDWLREAKPDIALLQETKCQEDALPRLELEDLGYNVAAVGQKSYNGVALLARFPFTVERTSLPGDENDTQARYIEAVVEAPGPEDNGGGNGEDNGGDGGRRVLRVASIYLPNGNPVSSEKFAYKLAWLDRLRSHVAELLALEEVLVLGGDYNVAPTDRDVYDPEGWRDDALCHSESRRHYRAIVHLGLTDAYRAIEPEKPGYSFWDYQGGCWPRDEGLRIDHLLLSPQAADRLVEADVDRGPRGRDKPSDHTPVWCALDL